MNTTETTTITETHQRAAKDTAQAMLNAIYQARAVMRTVGLAAAAQEDGAVSYQDDDNSAKRWLPAVDFAAKRIATVRDLAIEGDGTSAITSVAWYTPLTLLQALGAALWRGESDSEGALDEMELQVAAQATIDALDSLASECAATVH